MIVILMITVVVVVVEMDVVLSIMVMMEMRHHLVSLHCKQAHQPKPQHRHSHDVFSNRKLRQDLTQRSCRW